LLLDMYGSTIINDTNVNSILIKKFDISPSNKNENNIINIAKFILISP
jgi:hypothetical protein